MQHLFWLAVADSWLRVYVWGTFISELFCCCSNLHWSFFVLDPVLSQGPKYCPP